MRGLLGIKRVIDKQFTITVVGVLVELFLEFDPKIHTPTCFVSPYQDPRTDTTTITKPADAKEGDMIIFPSYTLHYVEPNNYRKRRVSNII